MPLLNKYDFESEYFGTSAMGIHLLRSRFNFETIPYQNIQRVVIKRRKELKHWRRVLVFGVLLFIIGALLLADSIYLFETQEFRPFTAKILIFFFLPLTIGGYAIFMALRSAIVLEVDYLNGKKEILSLRGMKQHNMDLKFEAYLQAKIPGRLFLHPNLKGY